MYDLFLNTPVLHTVGMINSIESVQRRFTKKLRGMSLLTYDERCACLGLDRLELRRLQCDLITCFTIIHGLIVLDRRNSLLLVVNKLHVVINLNCVCSTVESMLESISLVRV